VPLPAAAPPPVLLAGHLHPGVLFLRFVDGVQRAVLPLVLGLAVERWFLALAAVLFVSQMSYGLVRYLTFQFVLTTEELITREGILNRQERRIPIDRIQDLGFESTLLRRLFGLVVVSVETASGSGKEALLDSLGRWEAERLREALLAVRSSRGTASAAAAVQLPPMADEIRLFAATTGELLLRGITDLRIGALLLTALAMLQFANEVPVVELRLLLGKFLQWLQSFPPAVLVALAAGLVLLVLGTGLIAAVAGNLVMFHGFVLGLRGEVLQRRYGLLTTRSKALPLRRVQRVVIEQSWLRRLLGYATVRVDSAGGSMDQSNDSKGGWDVVVPLCERARAEALLPVLLPHLAWDGAIWHAVSPRVVLRLFLKGALLVSLLLAAGLPALGAPALLATVLLPAAFAIGWLTWRNVAWAEVPGQLLLQWGWLGRYRAFVPVRKVQSVIVRAGPVERLLGLATVTVYVAGGSPTALGDLPYADALALQSQLATAAAQSARADWTCRRRADVPAPAAPMA